MDASSNSPAPARSSAPLVVLYWVIVLLPLGWGVYQTVQKSIPLFKVTSAASSQSSATTPAATPPEK